MQEMEPKYFNKVDDIWLMDANLKRKENIEELMMEWQSDFEDMQNEGTDMNVLDLQNSIEEETSQINKGSIDQAKIILN